jgi:hypothetical protein
MSGYPDLTQRQRLIAFSLSSNVYVIRVSSDAGDLVMGIAVVFGVIAFTTRGMTRETLTYSRCVPGIEQLGFLCAGKKYSSKLTTFDAVRSLGGARRSEVDFKSAVRSVGHRLPDALATSVSWERLSTVICDALSGVD